MDNAPEILAQVEEVIIPMILFTQENKLLGEILVLIICRVITNEDGHCSRYA